jgi:high-affinity nickel-transport protein
MADSGMAWRGWVKHGILLVSVATLQRDSQLMISGGAICGTFVVFGGLSVILYKPWRRRIDKKRVRNAHFEPLPQDLVATPRDADELHDAPASGSEGVKALDIKVQPIEATDVAGPAPR